MKSLTEVQAYHGSNHHFEEFSADHIGTGKGYQTFGWGIYLTKEKMIAQRYRKRGSGKIYVVDMPDIKEMLDWNKTFSEQSAYVQRCLMKIDYPAIRQKMVDEEIVSGYIDSYKNDSGEDIYGIIATSVMSWTPFTIESHRTDRMKASITLLHAGIAGIKYFDVESNNRQLENYVIFDPHRIKIKKIIK